MSKPTAKPYKIQSIAFVKGASAWKHLPEESIPEVAFIGRSNVGKSSLINMLVERKNLARTSGTPGKTQEFNFFLLNEQFYLVDLPGFGYARVAKTQRARWQRFIGQYLTGREPLRVVFHLVDSRHEPTALDKEIMLLMKDSAASYIVLLTKGDKLKRNERAKSVARARKALAANGLEVPVVLTSAAKREGRAEVFGWIETLLA